MTNEEAAAVLGVTAVYDQTTREAVTLAIAALRSPAHGAAEMREMAYMVAWRAVPEFVDDGNGGMRPPTSADFSNQVAAAIRALPLPAPEVPEAVKVWCARDDKETAKGAYPAAVDNALRDWIRREYGI